MTQRKFDLEAGLRVLATQFHSVPQFNNDDEEGMWYFTNTGMDSLRRRPYNGEYDTLSEAARWALRRFRRMGEQELVRLSEETTNITNLHAAIDSVGNIGKDDE